MVMVMVKGVGLGADVDMVVNRMLGGCRGFGTTGRGGAENK